MEITVEQQILAELTLLNKQVTEIKHGQELMETSLLGSAKGDTEHGRLPIVEAKVKDHGGRIAILEENQTRWKAFMTAGIAIGSVLGSVATLLVRSLFDMWRH